MGSRDYQITGKNQIREHFKNGIKKVLYWLATGGGKTHVFCDIAKDVAARDKRVIVVVRGRKLVKQASDRLFREHVLHGVLMAGHWNYRPHVSVQVCSIDTLIARGLRPPADLIIIDEAHLAVSEGYKKFLSQYPDTFVLAVTATPWVAGGLRHIADAVVHPITMLQLIEQGYLVPFRYFAPSEPDLKDVKISSSTKDYVTDQLEGAMVAGQLTGKIIEHWKKLAEDRPTICFAVNVHHSKILVDRFLEAGITAEHCDADTPDAERDEIQKRVERGETKVVCNVGILSVGVDIPSVGCIIMARPTQSRNLFIQQAGRGTRPFPDKKNCILLDHAGNIGRHGLPTDETDVDLDGRDKSDKGGGLKTKLCKECFAMYRGTICPECGIEPPPAPEMEIAETEDELVELTNIEPDPVLRAYKILQRQARDTGKKPAWAMHKLVERFSLEAAKPHLPQWFIRLKTKPADALFANSPFQAVGELEGW